jgi:hypothetical protein
MHLKNMRNPYQESLGSTFHQCPKAVLGAAFASLASCGGDHLDDTEIALRREWWVLHRAGIVPQKPPFADSNPCDE